MPKKISKTWEVWDNIMNFFKSQDDGDDKGIQIVGGQFSVGSVEDPRETCLGSGDSYPIQNAFHCDIANTSGLTITSAIDVTAILESDTGSATSLFSGITAGKYLLVGSDYKFEGVKVKTTVAGVIEPDSLIAEVIQDNVPTYQEATFMATNANDINQQLGRVITTEPSEQWRFGVNPLTQTIPWDKVTLNINGVDITKYWGRFRLIDAITSDATIEQVKMHTDRTEFNALQGEEMFGGHRYSSVLFEGMKNVITNTLKNPPNENVKYAVGVTGLFSDNELVNNTEDGFVIPITIPVGLDTSIPLILDITGYPKSNDAGVVKFAVDVYSISSGFKYDGLATPDITLTGIDSFPLGSLEVRRTAQFLIPVDKLIPTEEVLLSFYRLGNDAEDTLNASAVITNIQCTGAFWKIQ